VRASASFHLKARCSGEKIAPYFLPLGGVGDFTHLERESRRVVPPLYSILLDGNSEREPAWRGEHAAGLIIDGCKGFDIELSSVRLARIMSTCTSKFSTHNTSKSRGAFMQAGVCFAGWRDLLTRQQCMGSEWGEFALRVRSWDDWIQQHLVQSKIYTLLNCQTLRVETTWQLWNFTGRLPFNFVFYILLHDCFYLLKLS